MVTMNLAETVEDTCPAKTSFSNHKFGAISILAIGYHTPLYHMYHTLVLHLAAT